MNKMNIDLKFCGPKVCIILLNWNGYIDTIDCIYSLNKMNYNNAKILVIDNGSTDNSPNLIRQKFPNITLIENENNLGFCAGNNIGLRYALKANFDYIWILNNDTTVEQKALVEIIKVAESDKSIGIVSPQINYYDKKKEIQFAGSYIDRKRLTLNYPRNKYHVNEVYQKGNDVVLWGTALLIRTELIKKIGYLREDYFAYWEDIDYSLRSLKAGYKNILCKDALIYHKRKLDKQGKEVPKGEMFYYLFLRNYIHFFHKNTEGFYKKQISKLKGLLFCLAHVKNYSRNLQDISFLGIWHGLLGIGEKYEKNKDVPFIAKVIFKALMFFPGVFIFDLINLDFEVIKKRLSGYALKKRTFKSN